MYYTLAILMAIAPVQSYRVNIPVDRANVWKIDVYMEILEFLVLFKKFSIQHMIWSYFQVYII